MSETMHIENMFARIATLKLKTTRVKYTQASGLPDWIGDIQGEISAGSNSSPYYTNQIPNIQYAETISIGGNVTSIGASAFQGCDELTSVWIPDSVTNIGNMAFYNCTNLTTIRLSENVTTGGYWIFGYCSNLSVISNEDISRVWLSMFGYCTGLTRLTFSSSIHGLSQDAFTNCTNLRIFDFRKSTSVPTLTTVGTFNNTPANKEIIVPDSLYDSWKAASNWSSTTNNIVNCIVKASQSSLGSLT